MENEIKTGKLIQAGLCLMDKAKNMQVAQCLEQPQRNSNDSKNIPPISTSSWCVHCTTALV